MEFIHGVPRIAINEKKIIDSVISLDEDKEKISVVIAQCVPEFERGFVCDVQFQYDICDTDGCVVGGYYDTVSDLVLVYVNKKASTIEFSEFEYVFYKK